jgi:DNA polymerase I
MIKNNPLKRLFLIDGSAVAYRSYYAFVRNPLINSKGENVSAVFGFTQTMLNILDTEKPDYFAVVFDTPEPTFRHKLFDQYKAQRVAMPDDMVEQLPRIQEMLNALNVPTIALPGFEADDVMGTLAKTATNMNIFTVLVTGDKDLMQLVNARTVIFNPKRGGEATEWLDEKGVADKMGVQPAQIIDYLALAGDTSDNIPGVPNIGPKTALALLQQHGSLDNIYQNLEKISAKRARENLELYREQAMLSYQLATIHCNVPLDVEIADLKPAVIDHQRAFDFFQAMEFRSLANRFAPKAAVTEVAYHLVNDPKSLTGLVETLQSLSIFAFDTETTDVDPMRAELVGLSFSWKDGEAYYIPVKGPKDLAEQAQILDVKMVLNLLRPVLENENIRKCGHNAKYDMLVLSQHGVQVQGLAFDTMVANYLINPSVRQHNLDALGLSYFNLIKITTESLIGSGKNQKRMDEVPLDKIKDYACEDADVTWRLQTVLSARIKEFELQPLLETVEMPLVQVLMIMEQNGVALDTLYLARMSDELQIDLDRLEKYIYKLADVKFNINSPKQLAEILFEKLKLPHARRTKTGYSTDVAVLEELAFKHELPRQILEYRQLAKLKSTYIDALPRLVNLKTGRVHTSYNQTVAATGRLSSSDPNLQNIPIRTDIGRRIRQAFVSRDQNHVILDADYSQIELRIMAHLSNDDTLRSSFMNNEDVHARTAALIFNVDPVQVTSDQRRKAKEVNFGIMYGMSAWGLAKRLGISNEEGDSFIKTYFAGYPGVQDFILRIIRDAREKGFVTTLLNRRRYLPEIKSDNRQMREFAERTAINTPIQGSAADLIKVAMVNIQNRLSGEKLDSKMIMQVHDELVFDVRKDELEYMKGLVKTEMEKAIQLNVPVRVDMGVGEHWLEAH